MLQKILIYDSDLTGIDELNTSLSEHGFRIEAHNNPEDTKRNLEKDNVDLFIICLHNKSVEPHRLLDEFKANKTDIPFVFAMDYDDNMTIANHYDEALCFHDTRYSNLDDTVKTILNALHHIHKSSEVHERISSAYDKIKAAIPRIIKSREPILVVGEKGTGKSYFAQELHNRIFNDKRTCMSWSAETCLEENFEAELFGSSYQARNSSIRHHRGILEQAQDSVLFIDGFHTLSPRNMKILKSLIKKGTYHRVGDRTIMELKTRLVLSAEPVLDMMLEDGTFDRGLYHLLAKNRVNMPSLKEATEDIKPMAIMFLHEYCVENNIEEPTITASALRYLETRLWHDNLRELKVCVEQAVDHHHGHKIFKTDFMAVTTRNKGCISPNQECKQTYVDALRFCSGNVTAAADKLNISKSTFIRRLEKYGIEPNDYRCKKYNCGKKKKQST